MKASHIINAATGLVEQALNWYYENAVVPYLIVRYDDSLAHLKEHFTVAGSSMTLYLNMSSTAIINLAIGDGVVSFDARFNGVSKHIAIPTQFITGIMPSGSPGEVGQEQADTISYYLGLIKLSATMIAGSDTVLPSNAPDDNDDDLSPFDPPPTKPTTNVTPLRPSAKKPGLKVVK